MTRKPLPFRVLLPAGLLVLVTAMPATARQGDNCQSDIDGSMDTEVNVLDLLALLGGWGQTGPPRPAADIAPFPKGDDTVNVQDLLQMLGNWGTCTPSFRICSDALYPTNLDARIVADGSYPFVIDGVLDGPRRGPTNDPSSWFFGIRCGWDYYGPDAIPGNYRFGDTFGIDMSTDPFTRGGDVWFHYTASCNGFAFFEVGSNCGSGELHNAVIEVYAGDQCPEDWREAWNCTQNIAEEMCSSDQSAARIPILVGETYLIRIGGWRAEQGAGVLTVSCVDNSVFANALPLAINDEILGSTVNAQTTTISACQGVPVEAPGHWYTVIGNGSTLTASTCYSLTYGIRLYDTRLSVFRDTEGGLEGLACMGAAQNDTCELHESVSWPTALGQRYYVLVHGTPDLDPPFVSEGRYLLEIDDY